ncbi:Leucine rich repeat 5-containing protein [Aphelenchoides besseyi]|nr:Leucine rich repeat 5-containing protein [Aphelenchoides besseyi]KAI6201579.1 Leucine rich repeat 5-containing protein [Aphelenchoides besseyi]
MNVCSDDGTFIVPKLDSDRTNNLTSFAIKSRLTTENYKKTLLLLLIMLLNSQIATTKETLRLEECPHGCLCVDPTTVECIDVEMESIPTDWPTSLERIILKNCTLNTVKKNAFRKFQLLQEVKLEKCPNLDVIDKHAFKGLQKLRTLSVIANPKLRELHRYAFSAIGNENPLRIVIKHNGLEKIHAFAFKNAHNLRELHIEERCFTVESDGLSGISRLDFMTLKGVCVLNRDSFSNSSRIHNLNLIDSTLNLRSGIFSKLSHVNQIQLRENRIGKIEEESFSGMFTVGGLQLQANHIGRMGARSFMSMENVGELIFSYNTVREPLDSADCLSHSAYKLIFTENTLHCSCEMQWIQFHSEKNLLAENYCDRSEAFKALAYFKPVGCPSMSTTELPTTATEIKNLPSEVFVADSDRQIGIYGAKTSGASNSKYVSSYQLFFLVLLHITLFNRSLRNFYSTLSFVF